MKFQSRKGNKKLARSY